MKTRKQIFMEVVWFFVLLLIVFLLLGKYLMKMIFGEFCGIYNLNNGCICVKLHKLIYGMTQ